MASIKDYMPNLAHTMAGKLNWEYRKATWRIRALPDFLIIGAQKAGTTSLYAYLSQHPELAPSLVKEVHFFDGGSNPALDNFEKGQAWYRAHFHLKKNTLTHQKTFDTSPVYIFHPLVPKRIFDLIPNVKIIALLRNPTERAISQYFHAQRQNREPLSMYEAMQEEEKRLESVLKNEDYKNDTFLHHTYKSRGLYKQQLERYLNYFPREHILVINSEDFFSRPGVILKRVFEFVGVDPGFTVPNLKPENVSSNKSDVAPNVYEYLNNYFSPHNQALYEQIGERYAW